MIYISNYAFHCRQENNFHGKQIPLGTTEGAPVNCSQLKKMLDNAKLILALVFSSGHTHTRIYPSVYTLTTSALTYLL